MIARNQAWPYDRALDKTRAREHAEEWRGGELLRLEIAGISIGEILEQVHQIDASLAHERLDDRSALNLFDETSDG